jgi:heme A synthase
MQQEIGALFGSLIVLFYILTVLNFLVKWINKKYGPSMKSNEKGYARYKRFMRFIVKNHKLFGLLTIVFLLVHFFIQFNIYGLSITGLVAAGILILQILLGIYGAKTKNKGKTWLTIHRSIAVLLFVAILIHTI